MAALAASMPAVLDFGFSLNPTPALVAMTQSLLWMPLLADLKDEGGEATSSLPLPSSSQLYRAANGSQDGVSMLMLQMSDAAFLL